MTTVDVVIEDERWAALRLVPLATKATDAVARKLRLTAPYEIALLACDDATIAKLNEDFRGKPRPTNVLSWPAFDLAPLSPGENPAPPPPLSEPDTSLGDIALAYDTCQREAVEQAKEFTDHVTHLIVHGTLHLLGYDHETDPDAEVMERMETEILAELGISDPYS